jgi:Holliday junction DNA helicase RuvA
MISSLKGTISKIWGNYVEVEVNDVGYWVFVGLDFLKKHNESDRVKIFTHMAVSENDMSLYGFESWDQLQLFKMMITVSGVGPKTGAQILGSCNSDEIVKAIASADVEFFQKIKGIGKKTAQRIIIDLKSKIGGLGELDLTDSSATEEDDLFLSLKQLGFDRKEIDKIMKRVPVEIVEIEERLGWCLQNLGR